MWQPANRASGVYGRAARAIEKGRAGVLATDLASGDKLWLDELDPAAAELLATGRPRLVEDWPAATPRNRVYLEPVGLDPILVIAGAGHVGRETAELAARAGFRVTLADDRADLIDPTRLPSGVAGRGGPLPEVLAGLPEGERVYYLVVTRGHAADRECLAALLTRPSAYLGMIGSRRKVAATLAALQAAGAAPDRLARVSAPVGLDLGGDTPVEIAVSIVAQLIAVRRGKARSGGPRELVSAAAAEAGNRCAAGGT